MGWWGAQPEWQSRPMPWWRLDGSYSFLDMHVKKGTDSIDIGSAPGVLGSSPVPQALLRNRFDLPKSVSTDINVRYVSALPGIQVPSYWTGDAAVQWAAARHVGSKAVGQNFFSLTMSSSTTIPDLPPEPGADFMAK